ncbi:MAG: ABC transporter permease [Acidobacteria bacterium]|nr:ABC transporter permease [Acidobacteriota bacterium]
MVFRDLFQDTLRTLWTHKLRTFLSMFGIAWGIVSITLMIAAGEGLRVGLKQQHENFAKDIMIVFAGRTSMQAGGVRAGRRLWWFDRDVEAVRQEAAACKHVMPELGNNATVRSLYNNGNILITGSLPPFAEVRSIPVGEGRFYDWQDQAEGRRVAFLGNETKKQLFGTRNAMGETIELDGMPYVVIGAMREKRQNSSYDGFDGRKVFVPFRAILRDLPNKEPAPGESVDRLIVAPYSWETHEACELQVRRTLARLHDFDPRDKEAASIWDTVKEAKANAMIVDGMKYFLGAIGVATLFLGGIGVMNVMLVAVRERTREIGVRKAVGATRRAILGQFFVETLIVVFLSGGVGMGIAYGLCALVNLIPMPPFFAGLLADWKTGLLSFSLLGTVAVLAAMYPARRAASVDPIEALRYEAGG